MSIDSKVVILEDNKISYICYHLHHYLDFSSKDDEYDYRNNGFFYYTKSHDGIDLYIRKYIHSANFFLINKSGLSHREVAEIFSKYKDRKKILIVSLEDFKIYCKILCLKMCPVNQEFDFDKSNDYYVDYVYKMLRNKKAIDAFKVRQLFRFFEEFTYFLEEKGICYFEDLF